MRRFADANEIFYEFKVILKLTVHQLFTGFSDTTVEGFSKLNQFSDVSFEDKTDFGTAFLESFFIVSLNEIVNMNHKKYQSYFIVVIYLSFLKIYLFIGFF